MKYATTGSMRRGVVLVVMLVLLAVIMLLAASLAGRVVSERRQLRLQMRQLQAVRLAESGLARAQARLARDTAYMGEQWDLSADDWEGGQAARVEITLRPPNELRNAIEITARATYPLGGEQSIRRTRSTVIFPQRTK